MPAAVPGALREPGKASSCTCSLCHLWSCRTGKQHAKLVGAGAGQMILVKEFMAWAANSPTAPFTSSAVRAPCGGRCKATPTTGKTWVSASPASPLCLHGPLPPPLPPHAHLHTHKHTRTHACPHVCMHVSVWVRAYTRQHMYSHVCECLPTCMYCPRTQIHTCTHVCTHGRPHIQNQSLRDPRKNPTWGSLSPTGRESSWCPRVY